MKMNERIQELRPQMIDALKELIKCRSLQEEAQPGAPFGSETARCLEKALEISKNLGFRTYNMDGYVGWAEYGEGDEMVAVLCHLDVVPEGDGWTVCEPYDPVVKDGNLYGRGAIDNKGPCVASLFGMKALMDEGFVPDRRIRLIFGCNEETGSGDIHYYRTHGGEIPVAGFTPDANYPLVNGEKGYMNLGFEKTLVQNGPWKLVSIEGGAASNIVPQYCKAVLNVDADIDARDIVLSVENAFVDNEAFNENIFWKLESNASGSVVTIEAKGISAHASLPQFGENAIGRMCLFLKNLPLNCEATNFIADKIGMEHTGKSLNVDLWDEPSGPLTLNMGIISSYLNEENVVIRVLLDSRCPVTFQKEDLIPVLKTQFEGAGWTTYQEGWANPLYQSLESESVQKLLKAYRDVTGDDSPAMCIGGGTYAKSMPNIMAFGPCRKGIDNREHGADEFIILDDMMQDAEIYARAMQALATK